MKKIFLAGHRGMVGRAIYKKLALSKNVDIITKTRRELDLCDQNLVKDFMEDERPDEVILCAAKVGGIYANDTYPADFIYQNLQIQNNVIHFSHKIDVQKLLFLGSSCIYPKETNQPMKETELLNGKLEATNEPYAIAKIAGIKMCESYNRQYGREYRSVMPSNLYGPGDNYHPENSHVIPALIRRVHHAKLNNDPEVLVWGTGTPKREFLFVEDMAEASLFIHDLEQEIYLEHTTPGQSHINIGSGKDVTIKELAEAVCRVVGFSGKITFDTSKNDGTHRKLMCSNLINKLGWKSQIDLKVGLELSYADFVYNNSKVRA